LELILFRGLRIGRTVVVVAVILFFAATGVMAGSTRSARTDDGDRTTIIVSLVKAPVMVLKNIAVTQTKLERHVSSSLLHAGVDAFARVVRWLSRESKAKPAVSRLPREL
jgi:hypothetical protein